jgi:hypothetical protein
MMCDHTTPICPLPGLGQCVRERCNFWDEEKEECTADCGDGASAPDPDGPCLITFYEDYD